MHYGLIEKIIMDDDNIVLKIVKAIYAITVLITHIWTVIIALQNGKIITGIIAFFTPVFSWIYWGIFHHYLCNSIYVVLVIILISISIILLIIDFISDKLSNL